MTGIWDVSNDAIKAGNYSGMWKLTVLTSVLQVLPLALIWLILGRCGAHLYLHFAFFVKKMGEKSFLRLF